MSIMFYVDNVDIQYERVSNSKYDTYIIEKPNDKPWGTRAFVFLDPDGNQINFLHKK